MIETPTRVLILGASGMLGNAALRLFAESPGYEAYGTVRSQAALRLLPESVRGNLVVGVDVENIDSMMAVLDRVRPHVVINCIGIVKQLAQADDPLQAIPINALLPHRLARMCALVNARFVHMSTDCVFSGAKGMYTEDDQSDAYDLYGRSKFLGEVDYPNAITLRTSIIGHELDRNTSLIGWFLKQEGKVRGFERAIFSGLPTVEVARVIRDFVIPHPDLRGVYNLSAEPVNKFDLLALVAEAYGKQIEIVRDQELVIDRSLDSSRFRRATGFVPLSWPELVRVMRDFK
jgi:dTDP-4-dehydrorhamnose reductase